MVGMRDNACCVGSFVMPGICQEKKSPTWLKQAGDSLVATTTSRVAS